MSSINWCRSTLCQARRGTIIDDSGIKAVLVQYAPSYVLIKLISNGKVSEGVHRVEMPGAWLPSPPDAVGALARAGAGELPGGVRLSHKTRGGGYVFKDGSAIHIVAGEPVISFKGWSLVA